MDIHDLLNGKPLTRQNLYELQRDPRASGLSPEYDGRFALTIENALRELNESERLENLSIPKKQSKALQMMTDDVLNFDFLVQAKKDPRYHDPGRRDPAYCKAIDLACQELGQLREKKLSEQEAADQGPNNVLLGVKPGVSSVKHELEADYEDD